MKVKRPALTLVRKIALLALAVPVAVAISAAISVQGASQLKSQYDNLYGFMLIPIMDLDQAKFATEEALGDIRSLEDPATDKNAALAEIKADDATIANVLQLYQTQWLSTLSPDFTAAVASAGKSSLQTQEAAQLKAWTDAYAAWVPTRDELLAGKAAPGAADAMQEMQTALNQLVDVNRGFADLSNTWAQGVISGLQFQLLVAGLTLGLLGLILCVLVGLSILRPVRRLTAAGERLAVGDVRVDIKETSQDEIGRMARSFGGLVDYMREMADVAGRLADGDLSGRHQPRSDDDLLGVAFAQMGTNLRALIGDLRDAAASLNDNAAQLDAAAEQAGRASGQVAQTINQVAAGAQDQARAATDTSEAAHQLSAVIAQVGQGAGDTTRRVEASSQALAEMSAAIGSTSKASDRLGDVATSAAAAAEHGASAVRETVAGMARIRATTAGAAEKVSELGAKGEQIGAIVETIDDIAEQTNLLALNAAIEAARAGEQGKGFAVVADEVRKLAERSSRATKEIAALIAEVQSGTEAAVEAMNAGARDVETGAALADQAGDSLDELAASVASTREVAGQIRKSVAAMEQAAAGVVAASDEIARIAGETNAAANRMTSAATTVGQSVESIAAISEENSASAEEVSAATEEMSAQAQEVVAAAASLNAMAGRLNDLVARFQLDDVASASGNVRALAASDGAWSAGRQGRRAA